MNLEEAFKERYADLGKPLIGDGIVNEERYWQAKPRILWIMKEANSTGEDDAWDMRGA